MDTITYDERERDKQQKYAARTKRERGMLFKREDTAQGMLEYALILMLVAVIIIVLLYLLGPAIGNLYSNVMSNI